MPARDRRWRRRLAALLLTLLAIAATILAVRLWPAGEIAGSARVIDGDSLAIQGTSIRLRGIDAPERRQTCRRERDEWSCGSDARERLRDLVEGETVTCAKVGTDRYRRVLGICRTERVEDIGALLVREGWALSFDGSYAREERAARRGGRGVWDSNFVPPREWRREHGIGYPR